MFSNEMLKYSHAEGADTSVGSIEAADVQPFPVEVTTCGNVTISPPACPSLPQSRPGPKWLSMSRGKALWIFPYHALPSLVQLVPGKLTMICCEVTPALWPLSEYEADYLLEKFSDLLCPAHVPDGQACATPLNPGTYGGDPPITVEIPEISDILAFFLGSGTYKAEATVMDAGGNPMTCLYVRIEVEVLKIKD